MLDIKTGAGKHSNLFSRMHGPDNCLPGVTRCSVCPPGVLSSVSIASSWSIVHPFPLLCLSVCFLLCTLRFPTASKAQGGLTAPPCSYSLVVESLFVAFILGLHSAFWPIFLNNSTSVLLWVSLPWGLAPWGCFSCVSLIFILFGPVLGLLTDSWLNSVELCLNQKQVSYPRFSTCLALSLRQACSQGSGKGAGRAGCWLGAQAWGPHTGREGERRPTGLLRGSWAGGLWQPCADPSRRHVTLRHSLIPLRRPRGWGLSPEQSPAGSCLVSVSYVLKIIRFFWLGVLSIDREIIVFRFPISLHIFALVSWVSSTSNIWTE